MSAFFPAVLLFSLTLTWLRSSWSAGTPRLRHVRIDRLVFISGGALELSLNSSSSARELQHWTWQLHCCFAGTGHQNVLDLTVDSTWHLLDHLHLSLHLCILHDVLIAPFKEGRVAKVLSKALEGCTFFAVCFCHTEAWTERNEHLMGAVLDEVGGSQTSWMIALDGDMYTRGVRRR